MQHKVLHIMLLCAVCKSERVERIRSLKSDVHRPVGIRPRTRLVQNSDGYMPLNFLKPPKEHWNKEAMQPKPEEELARGGLNFEEDGVGARCWCLPSLPMARS